MRKEIKQLKKIIDRSRRVLIIAHNGPDLDAFCSMLMVKTVFEDKFPRCKFVIQAKQGPSMRLPRMKDINIVSYLDSSDFDAVIVTDAGDLSICMTENDRVRVDNIPLVFIDHHDTVIKHKDNVLLINHNASSACEEVYMVFKDMFGNRFKLDKDVAELLQIGIVADTGRFLYDLTIPNTFRVFADAREVSPVDLEEFAYKNSKFPRESTVAIQEYLKTLTIDGDMAYMYIDRSTVNKSNDCKKGLSEAQSFLRDRYLRFIQGVHWGFIIKPDMSDDTKWYISFRSTKGYQDVRVIAEELGGGGHEYSAGVPFRAKSLNEVLDATLIAVKKHVRK